MLYKPFVTYCATQCPECKSMGSWITKTRPPEKPREPTEREHVCKRCGTEYRSLDTYACTTT